MILVGIGSLWARRLRRESCQPVREVLFAYPRVPLPKCRTLFEKHSGREPAPADGSPRRRAANAPHAEQRAHGQADRLRVVQVWRARCNSLVL